MKSVPFVPGVWEISAGEVDRVPGLEEAISYWSGRPAGEWLEEIHDCWGNAAFAMVRSDEVLGFAVFGPQEYLPNARRFRVGSLVEGAVLLAYVGGDDRTRRRLLVRVLRDLRSRKFGRVEAISSDSGARWHIPTKFLLESGWQPVRRGWRGGRSYTLVRTDLGNTVEVGELARGLPGRVKIPRLRPADPAPGAFVRGTPAEKKFTMAGSRS